MEQTRLQRPLIHCITNPISIHDCANAVLAVGARPIMAEHPREAAEITASADALALNLGNITDARMESIRLSLAEANRCGIPVILDLVGIACSSLRLHYARSLLADSSVTILKGNSSELRALAGIEQHSIGIDAGVGDSFSSENALSLAPVLTALSRQTDALLLATGADDLIWQGEHAWLGHNGVPMLSSITGTGCMLGVLTASYLAHGTPLEAALLAVSVMGIAGEAAETHKGSGTFALQLMDALSTLTFDQLTENINLEQLL